MTLSGRTLKTSLLLLSVALLALGAGYGISQWYQARQHDNSMPRGLEATVLDKARPLRPFRLVDHDGRPFTEQSLRDHWSFLFFGYVHCPDVCPIVLRVMQEAWQQIPQASDDPAPPQMIFVSVDPDRDTPELLKQYVRYFNPGFIGVTGPADEIDNLTGQLGILYGFDDKQAGTGEYLVNHSAQIILIDPQGRMRAVMSPPHEPATIAANFQTIRNYYGE
jgi:protein SCO1/2